LNEPGFNFSFFIVVYGLSGVVISRNDPTASDGL